MKDARIGPENEPTPETELNSLDNPKLVVRLCDCGCIGCEMKVEVPIETHVEAEMCGWIIISDGCEIGPANGDRLIKSEVGYKIYEPTEE